VRDVFFSGIFAGANRALSELAGWLGIDSDRADLDAWATRYSQAVQKQWDPSERLALDHDIRANAPIRVQTYAGFAPLLVPDLSADLRDSLVTELFVRASSVPKLQVPRDSQRRAGSPGFQKRSLLGVGRFGQ